MSSSQEDCIFCNKTNCKVISSTKYFFIIRDTAYPVTKHHTLIITNRHVADFFELTKEEMSIAVKAYRLMKGEVDLDELLKTSDVISIHVVKTEETTNLINNEKLNLIKKGGILVNTSRGGVVDEVALFKRSSDDVIFAGLDVFSQEPPDINKTFSTSNIVTTPHLGASTQEAQLRAGLETVQNISDILNGELSSVINI